MQSVPPVRPVRLQDGGVGGFARRLQLRLSRNTIRAPVSQTPNPIRLPLNQLRRGDRAVMATSDLSAEDLAVLGAMGLDANTAFTVCRAGRGGPCIIQLDATRLGLAPELAARILTRPCSCADTEHCAAEAPDQNAPPR
jgi:Fe2+ transport system protein FeoA